MRYLMLTDFPVIINKPGKYTRREDPTTEELAELFGKAEIKANRIVDKHSEERLFEHMGLDPTEIEWTEEITVKKQDQLHFIVVEEEKIHTVEFTL